MNSLDPRDRGRLVVGDRKPQHKLDKAIKAHPLSKNKIVAAVGISFPGIQYIIKGECRPRQGTAEKFCEVLGCDWSDIWSYTRKPEGGAS